jgi:hypothetical protein
MKNRYFAHQKQIQHSDCASGAVRRGDADRRPIRAQRIVESGVATLISLVFQDKNDENSLVRQHRRSFTHSRTALPNVLLLFLLLLLLSTKTRS